MGKKGKVSIKKKKSVTARDDVILSFVERSIRDFVTLIFSDMEHIHLV